LRYLIYGAGAVGGFVGGCLALAGNPVIFVGRATTRQAVIDRGLQLIGDKTSGLIKDPDFFERLDPVLGLPSPDVILLTTKAYDLATATEDLARFASPMPPVVCMLNGIGTDSYLAERIGPESVIPASVTTAVQMVQPGAIRVERRRGVGLTAGHPLSQAIFDDMHAAGLQPRLYSNPDRMKWSKLITNIVANATCAIMGWSPAAVYRYNALARLELKSLREAFRVMRALGLSPVNLPGVPVALFEPLLALPDPLVRTTIARVVASGRGAKSPSLHFDVGRRRSEIGWLNGAVVSWGARLGIPTPANDVLTDVMSELVMGEADPAVYRGRPEALLARASDARSPGVRYNAASTARER
jgi:2-dehydropantoate 2-reductase